MIVEDGTIVADADSYTTVAFADAYHAQQNNQEWTYRSDLQEAALINATSMVDLKHGLSYRGCLIDTVQSLLYPRTTFVDGNGRPQAANTVPLELQKCVCEYALLYVMEQDIYTNAIDGIITQESLGVGSGAYDESYTYSKAPEYYLSRKGYAWLTPLLKASNTVVKG